MFFNPPKIFAHISAVDEKNFVVNEYILNRNGTDINLFYRFCPHRMYPLGESGTHVSSITCKFHNFQWNFNGIPINNTKKLTCGKASLGKSRLIFKNFSEPDNHWVYDLEKETDLIYSHCCKGTSKGSWLWLMDAEADLLHLHKEGIHPFLSNQITLDDIVLEQGDGWILQNHPTGWWLYIFPFTFVEYGRPGMVMVNTVTPHNDTEYGFDWITQFYYSKIVSAERKYIFETLEDVFKEDVATAELQKGNYFPLMNAMNRYENHSVHFGNWVRANKK